MNIIISGLTASGKSSIARYIAEELGMDYFSASSKLRELLPENGFGSWESNGGLAAVKHRLADKSFDRKLDRLILKHLKTHDNVVMDSWTMAWLAKSISAIKIYVKADPDVRVRRVSRRDGMSTEKALKALKEKDKNTAQIYKDLYGIDIVNDLTPFNLVIDTSKLQEDKVEAICLKFVKSLLGLE